MSLNLRKIGSQMLHPSGYFVLLLVVLLAVLPTLPRNKFYEDLIVSMFFYGALASAWNLGKFLWATRRFSGSGPMLPLSSTCIMD
jgi:hypothetical protein